MMGRPLIRLDAVSSTQDVAFRLGALGAVEGTTVVARYQRAGRGRGERRWVAPSGEALLFSVLLRPELPPDRIGPLSILAADAIAATLAGRFDLHPCIKWPNDVLVSGRKLSGILIQARQGMVVIGVGLNLSSTSEALPEGATSIREETGRDVDADAILQPLLDALGERYRDVLNGDTAVAMGRVNERLFLRDEEAVLRDGQREMQGRVIGVRDDGALLLDVAGTVCEIVSGELVRGPRPVAR